MKKRSDIPLPKPSELHLMDGQKNLQKMKEQQPNLYRWRAMFGFVVLFICAIAGYFLFKDASEIIEWFKGFGLWGPFLFTIMLSLAIVLLLPTPFVKIGAGAIFPFWIAVLLTLLPR